MGKKFLIFWIIVEICVWIGGLIFLIVSPSWISALVWIGGCIIIDLPAFFSGVSEKGFGVFLFMLFLAPLFLWVDIYYTIKYRIL